MNKFLKLNVTPPGEHFQSCIKNGFKSQIEFGSNAWM